MNPELKNIEQENNEDQLKRLYNRIEEIKNEASEIGKLILKSGDSDKLRNYAMHGGGRIAKNLKHLEELIQEVKDDKLPKEEEEKITIGFLKKRIRSLENMLSFCRIFKENL